ncbi:MAG: C45 family peptidase [Bacteroidota bacterium]
MERKIYLLLFTVLFSVACQSTATKNSASLDEKAVESTVQHLADDKLIYLELSGTPYERGLTHGKLLKKEIEEVLQLLKDDIQQNSKQDADSFIAYFLKETDYVSDIEQWTPDLLEEVKGIAEGSGLAYADLLMHQLIDEYWFHTLNLSAHSCSSFGLNKREDQPSIAAQNMDIPPFYHGYQTVINVIEPETQKQTMYLTIPGHLGITGMNDQAVSINCNTLIQLGSGTTGLPVTFIVRGVLEKNTQEEALAFLHEIQHASGQNYIIGGPETVHSMECSANQVAEFRPFENAPFTYHTNHPMANTDFSQAFLGILGNASISIEQFQQEEFRCQRIASFQERFTSETEGVGIEDIKTVLRSRDNETRDVVSNENTYASVIYQLSGEPQFIIAPGKPHEEAYMHIPFK